MSLLTSTMIIMILHHTFLAREFFISSLDAFITISEYDTAKHPDSIRRGIISALVVLFELLATSFNVGTLPSSSSLQLRMHLIC
mmetsp:Transcript_2566/g.4807  ORF Transcript_2566/g.4807 Transcript_2566/m.4807 type:complete len:84 (-) Transcript_2566:127-378(-)